MTKIKIETETITTDLTPSEAAAKIKEALGVAEWPQENDWYWYVDDQGTEVPSQWDDDPIDHYHAAHGNCSPTREGLAQYKADMAKYAAIVAIRKHRDKTFGVFEPDWKDSEQEKWSGYYEHEDSAFRELFDGTGKDASITVYFATKDDIRRSFAGCGEHWEVLK